MFAVEKYAQVRQLVFLDGVSRREVARLLGLSRETVTKMCRFAEPPGYRRTKAVERPKLGAFVGVIDAILEADEQAPPKQRHTAKRIWQRLRDEYGFTGGYTTVKDYVRQALTRRREVFVPLAHPPGHAQIDFGESIAEIGGVRGKTHVFCMHLPYSDAIFLKAYPAETTEALLDGVASGFAFFGGVPLSVLLDNTKLAVVRINRDGSRDKTQGFARLISHFVFRDRYGRPGRGNDKGNVEALVKHSRRTFLTPVPSEADYAAFNQALEGRCRARLNETSGRNPAPIGERLVADLAAFRQLPCGPFEACDFKPARVSSTALVRYRNVDYSVPTGHAYRRVTIKGFVDTVVIVADGIEIARHVRSYTNGDMVFDPRHYLALLERKPGALDQAAPLQGWALPPSFAEIRRLLEARSGREGKREFIQILRLTEIAAAEVVGIVITDAIRRGVIGFDAVKQLLVARLEGCPVRLDPRAYPYLPTAKVQATSAGDYATLLSGRAA
jgi:transposase